MTWQTIGHEWAVKRLQRATEQGHLAQSHLFVGAPSIGKATLAQDVARALLSQSASDPARAATLVDQRKHPDLIWLEPDGETLKVDQVRDAIRTLSLSPIESAHRVAVIESAETMSIGAANALLKTLEEPNPRVVIIMLAPSIESVLPTISSRCQVLSLRPVSMAKIKHALMERGADESRATELAQYARGRIGNALTWLQAEDAIQPRQQNIGELEKLLNANLTQRLSFAEQASRLPSDKLNAMLDDWMLHWRAMLSQSETQWSATQITQALRAIHHAKNLIERNANVRLTLDVLLLDLPEK